MLKKTLMIAICLLVISTSATPAQASPSFIAKFLVKQAAKQVGRATGKNILNSGSEQQCLLWNTFFCEKVAK